MVMIEIEIVSNASQNQRFFLVLGFMIFLALGTTLLTYFMDFLRFFKP